MADITIKDVARQAGVSTATVSRVINGDSRVKAATAQRVQAAIDACHYVPNAHARSLKSDRTYTVGFLVSDISNSHFTRMARVIENALAERGYSMLICSTDDDGERERAYLERMMEAQVDGLILNTSGQNDALVAELCRRVPIVLADRSIAHPRFEGDYVGSNNSAGIQTLTQHLIDEGHRKIGIIRSSMAVSTNRERFAGFVAAMAGIGVAVDEGYPYRYDAGHFSVAGGYDGCRALMTLPEPPTALVVANNSMAIGALKYLRASGQPIPQAVSIAVYGGIENSELFSVEPTHVTLNPLFIGEKAAECLLQRIEDPGLRSREVIFQPVLQPGGSVRRLRGTETARHRYSEPLFPA